MTTSQPPKGKPGQVGNVQIDPGAVELVELRFQFYGGDNKILEVVTEPQPEEKPAEPALLFDYKYVRATEDAIVVALSVAVRAPGIASIDATARTRLTVNVDEGATLDMDRELAQIASRMGPVIIYPYLREVVADVTRRAGLEPLTLPVFQIGTFFKVDPDELRLEPPTEEEAPAKSAKATAKKKQASATKKAKTTK